VWKREPKKKRPFFGGRGRGRGENRHTVTKQTKNTRLTITEHTHTTHAHSGRRRRGGRYGDLSYSTISAMIDFSNPMIFA